MKFWVEERVRRKERKRFVKLYIETSFDQAVNTQNQKITWKVNNSIDDPLLVEKKNQKIKA